MTPCSNMSAACMRRSSIAAKSRRGRTRRINDLLTPCLPEHLSYPSVAPTHATPVAAYFPNLFNHWPFLVLAALRHEPGEVKGMARAQHVGKAAVGPHLLGVVQAVA